LVNKYGGMEMNAIKLIVHGKVQGVFYRKSAAEKARLLQLVGWVKNNPDGTVEIVAQGRDESIAQLVQWCSEGPKNAVVTKVEQEATSPGNYSGFNVIR